MDLRIFFCRGELSHRIRLSYSNCAYLPCSVRTIEKQVPHTHEMPKKNYLLKGTEEEKRLKIWQNQCWNSFAQPKGNRCAIRGQQTCRQRGTDVPSEGKDMPRDKWSRNCIFCIQGDRGDRGDRGKRHPNMVNPVLELIC